MPRPSADAQAEVLWPRHNDSVPSLPAPDHGARRRPLARRASGGTRRAAASSHGLRPSSTTGARPALIDGEARQLGASHEHLRVGVAVATVTSRRTHDATPSTVAARNGLNRSRRPRCAVTSVPSRQAPSELGGDCGVTAAAAPERVLYEHQREPRRPPLMPAERRRTVHAAPPGGTYGAGALSAHSARIAGRGTAACHRAHQR